MESISPSGEPDTSSLPPRRDKEIRSLPRSERATMAVERKFVVILLCFALLSCTAVGESGGNHPRRALTAAAPPTSVFDVTTFGARGDGKGSNVQAFMKAWNAACKSPQPATLLIPTGTFVAGEVVFQGPCAHPITVEVRGTVKSVTDLSSFTAMEWISFEMVTGLVVTGGGIFDGSGPAVWAHNNCGTSSSCGLLPTSLKFKKITDGVVRNITSVDAKSFHIGVTNCTRFTAEGLRIKAPEDSPNTDGLHISKSAAVAVLDSVIGTGDDCVSLGDGLTNVTIERITCGPGHGISVGSLGKYKDEEDVKGVVVRNCTFRNTTNGARIKTWPGSPPSRATQIMYEDIILDNVRNPILIDQNYGGTSKSKVANNRPSSVQLSNIQFRNIRGSSVNADAVTLSCSPSAPCDGVELRDIDITFNGAHAISSCQNAKITTRGVMNPPACAEPFGATPKNG